MDATDWYRINDADVAQETIDGETVIVNLATGTYYSLAGSGAAIWQAVAGGASIASATAAALAAYDGDEATVRAAVAELFARLLRDGLIAPGPTGAEPTFTAGERKPFEPPVLHTYRDLQDLLLLDPIHEVDEAGWPARQ